MVNYMLNTKITTSNYTPVNVTLYRASTPVGVKMLPSRRISTCQLRRILRGAGVSAETFSTAVVERNSASRVRSLVAVKM